MKPKIVIASNAAWNILNFRAGLVRSLLSSGYDVVALAPRDQYVERLKELGCSYQHIAIDNQGTHPIKDVLLLGQFVRILRQVRPCALLSYTVKPNIYGSLAAHMVGVPVINNVSGLGTVFIKNSAVTLIVRRLYRLALSRSRRVFFQNSDDLNLFVGEGLVPNAQVDLLPGSGIDLAQFRLLPLPARNSGGAFRFLLVGRMLWDKGVGEFVEAARQLKPLYPNVEFCLLGFVNVQNRTAISLDQVHSWVSEGIVKYLGSTDDVASEISQSDCIVLPSYREGTPRTLLEAASIGRPIVTTNAVGCREVVVNGVNGYLCEPRNSKDLADKLEKMILLPQAERQKMGIAGRARVEALFSEDIVVQKYKAAIDLVSRPHAHMNTNISRGSNVP